MREFIYYSKTAPTSGSGVKQDLIKSGRLDIAIHSIISSFFLSHSIREDVKLHLVFDGPPDPTKHLELIPNKDRNFKKSRLLKKNIDSPDIAMNHSFHFEKKLNNLQQN